MRAGMGGRNGGVDGRRRMAPLEGAILLAPSLRSRVLVAGVMVDTVLMMLNVRLCTWYRADRERNGSNSCQNESKFSHKHYPLVCFLSV